MRNYMQDLERSVIRILNQSGTTVGTGFIVADNIAVTCAHVVQAAGSAKGEPIWVQFYLGQNKQMAQVLIEGFSLQDDVAYLSLETLPEGILPVVLGTAERRTGHRYSALGFPRLAGYEVRWAHDELGGVVPIENRRPMLQCEGEKIKRGMSGAPILDLSSNRVIGMVCEYKDDELTRFAWATTADTLVALNRTLQLWPDVYGPDELYEYLQFVINENQTLILPDGREVQLERVYVSLRADEMNVVERQAEHDLYLEDVSTLKKLISEVIADQYAEFAAIRKVIVRHPKMLMLEARNWTRLFGERERGSLNLAEIVQRHPYVVVLGDPGSGKTTLGKWLVLQFARALQQHKSRVRVRADAVRPGAGADKLIDLGPPLLPIFIRIADYARTRWEKERGDSGLSLERFLGFYLSQKNLPSLLTPGGVTALVQDFLARGQAIVVLDGLDEVSDPVQRRTVMQAVKNFIQTHSPATLQNEWAGNRVLLTSRIVGYQFDPLTSLPHYTVEEMDDTAIAAFCNAWMSHVAIVNDSEVVEQAERLKETIFDHAHPGVRTLAGNPLLLTIMAQVYWRSAQRTLPTKRVALFEEAARALYHQRKALWDRVDLTLLRLTKALGAVAAYIHSNEVAGFAEEGEVRKQLGTVLTDSEQVEAVLSAARDVSGFLVARGEGVYGFLHRALQEYFAAQYLANRPEQVIENLTARLLDPTWREPIILAVGIVSHPQYPESRRLLPEVFAALQNSPDPAGDFLPRRELLAAAACSESERVPLQVGQPLVESLLNFYSGKEGRGKSPLVLARIQRAFANLYRSPAAVETEAALCAALQSPDFERRYAAADLIIVTKWESQAIAEALVAAWRSYAGPAAALLIALDDLSNRQPRLFEGAFLPLRQEVERDSTIWELIKRNREWQIIVRTLYLPPGADFTPGQITRDSPLTAQIIAALYQSSGLDSLAVFRQDLVSLATQPGTASARDAALALSALGDESWVNECVEHGEERKIGPLAAALTLAHSRDLVIIHKSDSADNMDLDLSQARDLAHSLNLELLRIRNIARTLVGARNANVDLVGNLVHDLEHSYSLARNLNLNHVLKHDFDRAHNLDRSRTINLARSTARTLDVTFNIDLANVHNLARDLDRSLDRDLTRELDRIRTRTRELETLIESLRQKWPENSEFMDLLELAIASVQAIRGLADPFVSLSRVWVVFVTACVKRWSISKSTEKSSPPSQTEITSDTLLVLVEDLASANDARRMNARKLLDTERQASTLGRSVIEQIASLAHTQADRYEVGTHLGWALHKVRHDVPDWLEEWIVQAQQGNTTAEKILSEIQKITPEAFTTVLQALPNAASGVNTTLLDSLSWLVRLRQIPKAQLADLQKLFLNWLAQELDPNTRAAVINVLGYWRDNPEDVITTLLEHLHDKGEASDIGAAYQALARMAEHLPKITGTVHDVLEKDCQRPGAAAALARLYVAEARNEVEGKMRGFFNFVEDRKHQEAVSTCALKKLTACVPHPLPSLIALLDAGTDNDLWSDEYHGVLATSARIHLEQFPDLLKALFAHLQRVLEEQEWPPRRIALAVVAACAEVMPIAIQRAFQGKLETLLVRGATDTRSFSSRRFALTALSYLRTVTPGVVPALLAGCRDTERVLRDAITSAGRFQSIEGDILSALIPLLTGESLSTAYAVAHLLGALGTSIAGEASGLRGQIVEALANALKDEKSEKEVLIAEERKGILKDALYSALLQVAGWAG